MPDELLHELAELVPMQDFKFQYVNDDPNDLSTSLGPEGWTDPGALKRLAQAELARRG